MPALARNTLRRYLRQSIPPGVRVRPAARRVTGEAREEARALYDGPAGGNAAVVLRLPLIEKGFDEQPAGVTEDRDQQEDAHPLVRDPNTLLV